MGLHRDPAEHFDKALRLISSVAELPPDIVVLRTRLAEFTGRAGTPMIDRIAAAVVDADDSADVDLLWSAGLAEVASNEQLRNHLLSSVRNRVHSAIRSRYAAHAIPVYEGIAALFNDAAQKFSQAATIVDPELVADAIVDGADKERAAWRSAANSADEMRRLIEPLHFAAMLAGICGSDRDELLALTVDAAGLHRRAVWQAWQIEDAEAKARRAADSHSAFTTGIGPTRSRCGRWSALHKLGATIRACPADEYADYPRPLPMREVVENTQGGPRRVFVDPEDELAAAHSTQ
jgi:hypothetical protein